MSGAGRNRTQPLTWLEIRTKICKTVIRLCPDVKRWCDRTLVVCQIQRFDFDCNLVVMRKVIIRTPPGLGGNPLSLDLVGFSKSMSTPSYSSTHSCLERKKKRRSSAPNASTHTKFSTSKVAHSPCAPIPLSMVPKKWTVEEQCDII
jgi:hypothetical protein